MDTNVVGYYRTSSQSNVGEDKDTKKRQQKEVMNYASSNVLTDFPFHQYPFWWFNHLDC